MTFCFAACIAQVNAGFAQLPNDGPWERPPSIQPQDLNDVYNKKGMFKKDKKMLCSASAMAHFSLYSIQIIQPLLARHGAKALQHPKWLSWCKQVEVITILHQSEITESQRIQLARAILEHQHLLRQVRKQILAMSCLCA